MLYRRRSRYPALRGGCTFLLYRPESDGSWLRNIPATIAVRFGHGHRTYGLPKLHRKNGWPVIRRIHGQKEHLELLPDVYDAKNHCFYEGTNQLVVYNTLKNAGLNLYAIAGIMGNIQVESQFDPERGDLLAGAYGLLQWQATRKQNLIDYASQSNLNYTSCQAQINFFFEECNNNSIFYDKDCSIGLNNLYHITIVNSTLLAADCVIAFCERCTHHASWEEVENAHYNNSWDISDRYDPTTKNQFDNCYYIDASLRRGYTEVYYKYLLDM